MSDEVTGNSIDLVECLVLQGLILDLEIVNKPISEHQDSIVGISMLQNLCFFPDAQDCFSEACVHRFLHIINTDL